MNLQKRLHTISSIVHHSAKTLFTVMQFLIRISHTKSWADLLRGLTCHHFEFVSLIGRLTVKGEALPSGIQGRTTASSTAANFSRYLPDSDILGGMSPRYLHCNSSMGRKRIEIQPIDDSKARSVSFHFNLCLICPFQCLVDICQTEAGRLQEGLRVRAINEVSG